MRVHSRYNTYLVKIPGNRQHQEYADTAGECTEEQGDSREVGACRQLQHHLAVADGTPQPSI